jgi:hypothetical protein
LIQRFNYLQPDGSLVIMSHPPMLWKRTGLDAKGVPVYGGKNYTSLVSKDYCQKDLSPYDFKPDYMNTMGAGGNGWVAGGLLADGGLVAQAWLRNSGSWA